MGRGRAPSRAAGAAVAERAATVAAALERGDGPAEPGRAREQAREMLGPLDGDAFERHGACRAVRPGDTDPACVEHTHHGAAAGRDGPDGHHQDGGPRAVPDRRMARCIARRMAGRVVGRVAGHLAGLLVDDQDRRPARREPAGPGPAPGVPRTRTSAPRTASPATSARATDRARSSGPSTATAPSCSSGSQESSGADGGRAPALGDAPEAPVPRLAAWASCAAVQAPGETWSAACAKARRRAGPGSSRDRVRAAPRGADRCRAARSCGAATARPTSANTARTG